MINVVSGKGQRVINPVDGCPLTHEIISIVKHASETLLICFEKNKTIRDEDLLRERCKVAMQDLDSIPGLINQIRGMPNKYVSPQRRKERKGRDSVEGVRIRANHCDRKKNLILGGNKNGNGKG